MKTKFVKTIKFRLALIFSAVLFLLTGLTILLFNVSIDNYLSTRQQPKPPASISSPQTQQAAPESQEQIDRRTRYTRDLESIQDKSIMSLAPLALLCFIIGYTLASSFLKPLKYLNSELDKLHSDNLGTQLENIPDNEIGKTMSHFNEMSLRLKTAFDQQTSFVQDASHELRTPLTIVRTNIETVLDDGKASAKELRIAMHEALGGLDSVTNLADDLLLLSRPIRRKKKNENLNEILESIIDELSVIAHKAKVTLALKLHPGVVKTDVNYQDLSRAIRNVIANAIKFCKHSTPAKVKVRLYQDKMSAIIEVEDNGIGIPKSDLPKIFDRFYRVDRSRDRDTGGSGLGLAITKKIIEDNNGKISVTSHPGKTIFKIVLPVI